MRGAPVILQPGIVMAQFPYWDHFNSAPGAVDAEFVELVLGEGGYVPQPSFKGYATSATRTACFSSSLRCRAGSGGPGGYSISSTAGCDQTS